DSRSRTLWSTVRHCELAAQRGLCLFQCRFFFNDTATTEIYTLSLHDALPICPHQHDDERTGRPISRAETRFAEIRSEEHTSELQSLTNLVCRLLLEKTSS